MGFMSDPSEPATIISDQPVDEAALIEERRKRREAIKAKHRLQQSLSLAAIPPIASLGHPNTAISISGLSQSHVFGMFLLELLDLLFSINLPSVRAQLVGTNREACHRTESTSRVLDR